MKLHTITTILVLAFSLPAFSESLGERTVKAIQQSDNIALAIAEIQETYGNKVSVFAKRKSLNKFGRRASVGTTSATVMELQGVELNETFVTTNIIDTAVSTNVADTQTITLEGHTIDTSGNFTFVMQQFTLSGQTEVTLTTPLARVNRAYITSSGSFATPATSLAGIASVFVGTDGSTNGVPNTASAVKLIVNDGANQTNKAASTISQGDYYIVTELYAGVGEGSGNANRVTFQIQLRDVANGGVWRPMGSAVSVGLNTGSNTEAFNPYRIIPKNHDFRVVAATDSGTAEVFAETRGVLALIVD